MTYAQIHALLIYSTAPSREVARTLARGLVESRLAACVNILPAMQSVYRWEGAIEEAEEVALLIKTTTAQTEAAMAYIKSHHPYQNPCALNFPASGGLTAYLEWIVDATR